jgi:predicted Rossmann fold flavoprotein
MAVLKLLPPYVSFILSLDMNKKSVIVIGAGAGGMMAAGRAAEVGADVILLEKMEQPGQKILISGKTRCNLTNARELDDFITAYGSNGRFLYSVFNHFFRDDLLAFLQRYGVKTKVERGGRIFPASDDARDVVKALERYLSDNKVQIKKGSRVKAIKTEKGKVTGVQTEKGDYAAEAVVLASGGASWPSTGSTGDGYRMAEALGHIIVKLRPALVPLVVREVELARSMQGISLKNVRLTAYRCTAEEIDSVKAGKSVIDSRMGEMMLTHFGIGGPITLQMSLAMVDALEKGPVSVAIDLKPALDMRQLQLRLQRDFDSFSKRSLVNILKEVLPQKMIQPVVLLSGIAAEKQGNQLKAGERDRLAALLKSLRFNIERPLSLATAMVTAGGVSLKEIDPRTLSSKKVKGLYFCGEVMDIEADTGGFNLQAAFSTGYVAGESAADFIRKA